MFLELVRTSCIFFDTSRASLVLLLLTHSSTAGFPFTYFKTLLFATLDFIIATSFSNILPPEIEFLNSSALKVSTNFFSPTVLTLKDPSAKLPPETSLVSNLIKLAIWLNDNFKRAVSDCDISIKISSLGRP